MKKILIILSCIILMLSLVSCSGGGEEESRPERPPAFSVLQKQLKLNKHSERSETTTFTEDEFSDFFGESITYITVTTLPESETGTLVFNGSAVMKGQSLPASQLDYLKFVPSASCSFASFNFTCDGEGYNGNEFSCEMVYSSEINFAPVAKDSYLQTVEGIACESKLDITEPNGDGYSINVITYPSDGYVSIGSDGSIVYIPEEGFYGNDSLVYTVTDRFGEESARATVSITVTENESGLRFADMEENLNHLYAHRMCDNNIMVYRYENGNYYFEPDAYVSKVDFLVMMMCVSGLDADITAVADSAVIDDTGLSSGLKGYLSAAVEAGIIKLENGNFSPESEISVVDAAYMISEALDLPESVGGEASETAFIDSVIKAGIIDAPESEADYTASLTKEDVSILLCRIEDYIVANNMNIVNK